MCQKPCHAKLQDAPADLALDLGSSLIERYVL